MNTCNFCPFIVLPAMGHMAYRGEDDHDIGSIWSSECSSVRVHFLQTLYTVGTDETVVVCG